RKPTVRLEVKRTWKERKWGRTLTFADGTIRHHECVLQPVDYNSTLRVWLIVILTIVIANTTSSKLHLPPALRVRAATWSGLLIGAGTAPPCTQNDDMIRNHGGVHVGPRYEGTRDGRMAIGGGIGCCRE